jgi:hypothetical protein
MLRDGHPAIAQPVDELGLAHHIGVQPLAAVRRIRVVSRQKVIELHEIFPIAAPDN